MKCSEVQDLLSAYFDHELGEPAHNDVEEHLKQCGKCCGELEGFKSLSKLASSLKKHPVPEELWDSISSEQSDSPSIELPARSNLLFNNWAYVGTSIALMLLIGFALIQWWPHGHDHEEMIEAMEHIASNIDSVESETILLAKFGGQKTTAEEANSQIGFLPVSTSSGLPDGYDVKNIQVLTMPCCKCVQTVCTRKDGSQFYVFEHVSEDTGWFDKKNREKFDCCGKECELVRLSQNLAVTWKKDSRHITLIGMRDEAEIELLVEQFEST